MEKTIYFVDAILSAATGSLNAKDVITIGAENADVLRLFKRHPLNRNIDPVNKKRIYDEIRKTRVVTAICVSAKNGYVLDGEHRRECLLELWENGECFDVTINVEFKYCPKDKNETGVMLALNNVKKGWNVRDYAELMEGAGNYSISRLKQFIADNQLATRGRGSYTKASVLIYGDRTINTYIKNGDTTMNITEEDFKEGERRLTEIRTAFHYAGIDDVLSSIFQGVAGGWYAWHKTQSYAEQYGIYTAEEAGKRIGRKMKKHLCTSGESARGWANYLSMVISAD